MKKNILISLICAASLVSYSQNWDWVQGSKRFDEKTGSNNNAAGDIISDNEGNVYVSGIFDAPSVFTSTDKKDITYDVMYEKRTNSFFAKYDSLGNIIWINTLLSKSFNQAHLYELGVDKDNNFFVYGNCGKNDILTSLDGKSYKIEGNNSLKLFIAKYTSEGNLQWVNIIEPNEKAPLLPSSIAIDSKGGFMILGKMYNRPINTLTFKYNGKIDTVDTGIKKLKSHSQNEFHFIAKYNNKGDLLWDECKTYNSQGPSVDKIVIDNDDNYIISGNYSKEIKLNEKTVLKQESSSLTMFFAKYDKKRKLIWAGDVSQTASNHQIPNIYPMAVTQNNELIIAMTQTYNAKIRIDGKIEDIVKEGKISELNTDILLICINEKGSLEWVKNAGTDGVDMCYSIALDKKDNIYLTGYFSLHSTMDKIPIRMDRDIFVSKYNNVGEKQWFMKAGQTMPENVSTNNRSRYEDIAFGVTVYNDNIYTCGMRSSNAPFGGIKMKDEYEKIEKSFRNIFIARINQKVDEELVVENNNIEKDTTEYVADNQNSETANKINETQNDILENFLVYPNPNKGIFTLEFDINYNSNVNIQITDGLGKEIYNNQLLGFDGHYKCEVYLDNHPPGVYFAVVLYGQQRKTLKIIKQ